MVNKAGRICQQDSRESSWKYFHSNNKKSVQSPYDPDSLYRNKGNQKIKGYSINVTESSDDDNPLCLISQVSVKRTSVSDVDLVKKIYYRNQNCKLLWQ